MCPRFYPVGDAKEQKHVIDALSGSPQLVKKVGDYFYTATKKQFAEKSFTLVGNKTEGVDIVGKIFRVVPIIWLANLVSVSVVSFLPVTDPFHRLGSSSRTRRTTMETIHLLSSSTFCPTSIRLSS